MNAIHCKCKPLQFTINITFPAQKTQENILTSCKAKTLCTYQDTSILHCKAKFLYFTHLFFIIIPYIILFKIPPPMIVSKIINPTLTSIQISAALA